MGNNENCTSLDDYTVTVVYGDKKLVDCMEEVIISMIRKAEDCEIEHLFSEEE